ncbi:general secretion pathway protein G [Chitinivorax tropicus]|uniref:General secretion pathway protein G n=1 Tax=Chitinivorax tropicus TaxID=714531 RepID=A0A840MMG1_9PROT|nr:type II secretion system protein [Chitinivorax tropicus]MBB5020334.1 general secretion pathway protein G [Chitinivorax tropicus]
MKKVMGFTLIEMLVTLTLLAILASAALPLTQMNARRSKEQELKSVLREIREAIDAYKKAADEGRVEKKADGSGYPASLQILVDGVDDKKSPQKRKLYFLRRVPRDPFFPDSAAPAASTWGYRSYNSPPDEPRAGDDVYDVYSLSTDKGMNGIPYRTW